jgi:mannosyltransferase OCH1-like enzyme
MIPNILWQTWKTEDIPKSLKNQYNSWKYSNPHLKRKISSDEMCSAFILQNFGEEVHRLYESLPQPIMRADFWRLAVIYIYGGYYSDLDVTCKKNLNEFVNGKVKAVFMKELDNIANFFFGAERNHPVLKLALDYMIEEAKSITDKDTQSYGMHNLHRAVREYYSVIGNNYIDNEDVQFLNNELLIEKNIFIHHAASNMNHLNDYDSWRMSNLIMQEKRNQSNNILFFTTFNENGFLLYGKKWIETFIQVSNFYTSFKAKIYYEGNVPQINHPNITYVDFNTEIPHHDSWKKELRKKSKHADYVKTMIERFSYKSFVIQDVLQKHNDDYLIWLDGDCVFKQADYTNFPKNILGDNFLACQVEENWDLNHVESGILIFNGKHNDIKIFNEAFIENYKFERLLPMGEPYDGFVVFKSLKETDLKYVNLNSKYGKGGIQSDPNCTFQHPEIKSKFIHNIGWTGKNQYENWDRIFRIDDTYKKMKSFLFGNPSNSSEEMKKRKTKIESLLNKKGSFLSSKKL